MSEQATKRSACIVRHSFYPAELNVKREAEALRDDGFSVHVICLRDRDEAAYAEVEGVIVHRLPVGHERGRIARYLWEYNAFFVMASLMLIWLYVNHNFAVIQVNTMPDYLVFITLIPRLMGAKVVLHMHEPVPELFGTMFDKWHTGFWMVLAKFSEKISLKFASHSLTVTREMRDNYRKRGADVNKMTVIVNVPDDKFFHAERYEHLREKIATTKKEERRAGIFRVLTHGAVEERYGQDTIVRAVAHLKEDIPGIRFRFMGGGSYADEIVKLSKELKAEENVNFLGFVPFDTMIEEILTADVTVVPVKKNRYSVLVHTNKMYEYVALGRPCIVSRLDSVAAYFPDDSLLYFESGDHEDLADKLKHVFAHPEEIDRRVSNAHEIYETYRWERERRKDLGVYHHLLDGADLPTT